MAENNTNRTVMYLSIAVVVLLVAFVAVVIVISGGAKTASDPGTTAPTSTTSTGTTQGGMSPSTTGFDPATATKVPSGSDPTKFATAYYQAILDKKWDVAFKMQPAKSQVGQTVEAFQQTQEQMYGMTEFAIADSQIGSSEATVVVAQTLREPNGVWTATWTFVKDGGNWLVKARAVAMGAPTATP